MFLVLFAPPWQSKLKGAKMGNPNRGLDSKRHHTLFFLIIVFLEFRFLIMAEINVHIILGDLCITKPN